MKNVYPYWLVIAGLLFWIFFFGKCEKEIVKVPEVKGSFSVEKDSLKPIVVYDTIFEKGEERIVEKLVEVENPVNVKILEAYEKALKENDSLKQKELFKEAVMKRKYEEVIEDDYQKIVVKSEVTGFLEALDIDYFIKERRIEQKKRKFELYGGVFGYGGDVGYGVGLNLGLKKNDRFYSVGYGLDKRIYLRYDFRFY